MAEFFVKTKSDGKVQGPFTGRQLKKLAAAGKLKPRYLVSDDQQAWHRASKVKGISFPAEQSERAPVPNESPGERIASRSDIPGDDIGLADAKVLVVRTDLLPHNASQRFGALYNRGCSLHADESYGRAEEAFTQALQAQETTRHERMLATYARATSANAHASEVVIPEEFQDAAAACGNLFDAIIVASHLIRDGHKAVAWGDGAWNAAAEVDGNFYHLTFSSRFGPLMNSANWLRDSQKTGLFEAAESAGSDSPHAYLLELLQDATRSGAPIALPEATGTASEIAPCTCCGKRSTTVWHCRKCDDIYCPECYVAPTERPTPNVIETEEVLMIDATDEGSRPTCPKCGSNLGKKQVALPAGDQGDIPAQQPGLDRSEVFVVLRPRTVAMHEVIKELRSELDDPVELNICTTDELKLDADTMARCRLVFQHSFPGRDNTPTSVEVFKRWTLLLAHWPARAGVTIAKQLPFCGKPTVAWHCDESSGFLSLVYDWENEVQSAHCIRMARTTQLVFEACERLMQYASQVEELFQEYVSSSDKEGIAARRAELRNVGVNINSTHGFKGMQEVCDEVYHRRGPHDKSYLARSWGGVGQWQT